MPGPLEGVKVLEFTEIIAGPFGGMLLGDMGADIIKVEPPWGEPWRFAQEFMPTESKTLSSFKTRTYGTYSAMTSAWRSPEPRKLAFL